MAMASNCKLLLCLLFVVFFRRGQRRKLDDGNFRVWAKSEVDSDDASRCVS